MTPVMVFFVNNEKIFDTLLCVSTSISLPQSMMIALSEASDILKSAFRKRLTYFCYRVCGNCPNLTIFVFHPISGWKMHNIV